MVASAFCYLLIAYDEVPQTIVWAYGGPLLRMGFGPARQPTVRVSVRRNPALCNPDGY